MFMEYPFSIDASKAEIKLNTMAHNKNTDKDQLYIVKESADYTAIIRMKIRNKTYEEQKWGIQCADKGLKLRRKFSIGYLIDTAVTGIFGMAGVLSVIFSFFQTGIRMELILLGLVFFLMVWFYVWKRIATPTIALKIFFIKKL